MKNMVYTIAIILLALIIGLLIFNQFTKRTITTEILIEASAEEVWKVLMDHKSYHEWNPFIKSIEGSAAEGEQLHVVIQSDANKTMSFDPLVLRNSENDEFRWVGKLGIKGVFDGEHYFILEKVDMNNTRFIHGENFSGVLSGTLLKMIGKDTEDGFEAMNAALKSRTENLTTT